MCVDMLDASRAVLRYIELYPAFQDSREFRLLKVNHLILQRDIDVLKMTRNCYIQYYDDFRY